MFVQGKRINSGKRLITVEPVLLGVYLATNLCNLNVFTHWIMTQVCWFENESSGIEAECFERDLTFKARAEEITGIFRMMHAAMVIVIPSIIGILMTSKWCKFGRKPLIIVPLIGQLCMWTTLCILSNVRTGNPFWTILATSFSLVSGGFVLSVAACLGYATDVESSPEKMALRFGFCASADVVSKLISIFLTPALLGQTGSEGYFKVFLTCAVSVGGALLYAVCFLPETADFNQELKEKIRLLKLSTLPKDAPCRMRKRRAFIFTLILATITSIYVSGEESVLYTTVRDKFRWSPDEFSLFFAANCFLCGFWATVGVWVFSTCMKIRDFFMMVILCLVIGMSGLLAAQSTSLHSFIVAMGMGSMLLVPLVICKSFAVSVVSSDKAASAVGRVVFCEALGSILGPAVYAYMYNHIAVTDPMSIFYAKTGFSMLGLILLRLIHASGESISKNLEVIPRSAQQLAAYHNSVGMAEHLEGFSRSTLTISTVDEQISLKQ